jgi:hypothetical protein
MPPASGSTRSAEPELPVMDVALATNKPDVAALQCAYHGV